MSDASEAARALSRQRWGSTRVDGLVSELARRQGELGVKQLTRLRELVDARTKEKV